MRRGRRIRLALALVITFVIGYYLVLPQLVAARARANELLQITPVLLVPALVLQGVALLSYSVFTRVLLLNDPRRPSLWRLFRIQLATRGLSSIVPGGQAAGSALGYRLLVAEGVQGTSAGFALATAGFGSAVVLNVLLVVGLVLSLPGRGVNPTYAAVAGTALAVFAGLGLLLTLLVKGRHVAESWARRLPLVDGDRAARVVRQLVGHLRSLAVNPRQLALAGLWAVANWVLDAASLWLFLRAFGQSAQLDALLVSFTAAYVSAAIPITPGGAGVVELVLTAALTGFGLSRDPTLLGVATYRAASWLLPIPMGALAYLSLRVGARPAEEALEEVLERDGSPMEWTERTIPAPAPEAGDGSVVDRRLSAPREQQQAAAREQADPEER